MGNFKLRISAILPNSWFYKRQTKTKPAASNSNHSPEELPPTPHSLHNSGRTHKHHHQHSFVKETVSFYTDSSGFSSPASNTARDREFNFSRLDFPESFSKNLSSSTSGKKRLIRRRRGKNRSCSVDYLQGVRRIGGRRREFERLAVVKCSVNPKKDFGESMAEMVVKKKIWKSKDMEDLLASYLFLNCDEYHDLIISVFRETWLDFLHTRNK